MHQHEQNILFRIIWMAAGFGSKLGSQYRYVSKCLPSSPYDIGWHRQTATRSKHPHISCLGIRSERQPLGKTPQVGDSDIHANDSARHCDYVLGPVCAHLWHKIFFGHWWCCARINDYAATLIKRLSKFEQTIYHDVPYLSLGLTLNCKWKLTVENYC